MTRKIDDFIHLYSLSKTLCFEARPIGDTLRNFIKNGLLELDEHRAESYVKVKKLIDEYHKTFIDRALKDGCLNYEDKGKYDSLTEYYTLYSASGRDETSQKHFKATQQHLRDQIVKKLTDDDAYKHLFGKELIESYKDKEDKKKRHEADLVQFINNANPKQRLNFSKKEAKDLAQEFCGFTTYFRGFHQNRENMYSAEEKSTGIAYRLINENLPKFIDNMQSFKKIAAIPEMENNLKEIHDNFAEYLNVEDIQDMFQLDYYNQLLTQKHIDAYNAIIGGKTDNEHKEKIKGLNEYVNQYNQTHKDAKLPKLKVLFKQILSDRNAISWLPEEFTKDQEVLNAIQDCYARLSENVLRDGVLKRLLCSLSEYDTKGIFLRNDLLLPNISQKMFGSWSVIPNAIKNDIKEDAPAKKRKESEEDYEKRIDNLFKKQDSFSINYIDVCLGKYVENNTHSIEGYFATLGAINTPSTQVENIFAQIANAYTDVEPLLNSAYPKNKKISQDKEDVAKIKQFLDALMSLLHFVKPLLGEGDESDKDERFYGELSLLWTELETIIPLYNMVRNYMTRKPYSKNKIKLNFDNSQLLGGWDANKESDYASILLRRDGMYYLAIFDKDSKKLLRKSMPSDGECYEKMVYKQISFTTGFGGFVRKCFGSATKLGWKCPPTCLNKDGKIIISNEEANGIRTELIDTYKSFLDIYEKDGFKYKDFGFHFKKSSVYENINDFFKEVEQQGYKITFTNVSVSFIDKLVKEGKMYLFQIYNKDFSAFSKGTPNMHTLYWKMLFDEHNLADVVYRINGGAELFFREKSIKSDHPTHPANRPIQNKNKDNKKKESVFEYDLIKDRRYTVDKFMFHVPITMNFKSTGTENINLPVREYLKTSNDTHIIGIDRGERHLLYLVVIDLHGNIVEQYSLNDIVNEYNGNTYRTNYHDLLDAREHDRLKQRLSWQTIESIKELKEGYLSQVVHKITQLMVKYHAIVVLEDLNLGFMRGRQKVEKQVYQKFEKMLIDKLNYLVDKKADIESVGGLLNAYQLTNKFDSFKKLGKQSGFLFYIPAWNTSKIDPVTGFVNLLDTRQNVDKAKAFFAKFDSIRYNKEKNWFEFALDYNNFGNKAEGTRTKWVLCTQGKRIKNAKKNSQRYNQVIDLTKDLKQLFAQYDIDINGNLKDAISNQTDRTFFVELMGLLKLTLQMRNSITGTEIDYLVSPVADENGNFYDSRTCGPSLPENADANGAFNIARKGLMIIEQIKASDDLSKLKFDISNKSWLKFAQQKPYKHE